MKNNRFSLAPQRVISNNLSKYNLNTKPTQNHLHNPYDSKAMKSNMPIMHPRSTNFLLLLKVLTQDLLQIQHLLMSA